jgi:surface polysaccharide O-acyltransferase-like enzyme
VLRRQNALNIPTLIAERIIVVMSPDAPQRWVYFDYLRLLAIALVIFNHTEAFQLYTETPTGSLKYWMYLAISVGDKVAVPLFFMLSGALLLGKVETLRGVGRRLLRVVVVIVVMSLLQYVLIKADFYNGWPANLASSPASFGEFVQTIYSSQVITPYYFLYLYASFLIALPLLRVLAQQMSDQLYVWLLAGWVIFRVVTVLINAFTGVAINSNLTLVFGPMIVFYPLAGFWVHKQLLQGNMRASRLTWLVGGGALMVAASCVLLTRVAPESQTYLGSLIELPTVAVFAIGGFVAARSGQPTSPRRVRVAHWVAEASGCVFGIYLLESILRRLLAPELGYLEVVMPTMPATMLFVLTVALAGMIIVWPLKKLPIIRDLL